MKCCGIIPAHFLTCVTLNLPPGWLSVAIEEDEWLWLEHYQEST